MPNTRGAPAADDPGRYSVLGHRGMPLWHPNDPGALERLIDAARLGPESSVLDVGCGRAEVALRIIERTDARVRAVDVSPAAIAIARDAASRRDPRGRLDAVCAPFDATGEAPVDLAVCIGSTHVLGGFDGTLTALGALLRPGGRLLIGEGFWAEEPDPQWLDRRFGGQRDAFCDLKALRARLAWGWRVVAEHQVSRAGWLAYESGHNANLRAAQGPDAAAMRARSDGWHGDWKRWGSALGFGLWLAARA